MARPFPQKLRPLQRVMLLALAVLIGLVGLHPAAPAMPGAAPAVQEELRGVWLTANDMPVLRDQARMEATVNQLADLGLNRLYPVVWNSGFAYYPSRVSEERQLQDFSFRGLQGQDVLASTLAAGHARGLLVIPWFEFGFMAPPDSTLARRHRNWLTQTRDGGLTSVSAAGRVVWLNPFRPEVQQLITDLVLEVVRDYDGDGIQFDDHMSLPREFGYDPFTADLYRRQSGRMPPADPADPAWVKWRADQITAFMARLSSAVKAVKPDAWVSISPNYYDFAYKVQLQDWRTWVERGLADELVIQIYRQDLASYVPELNRPEVAAARSGIPTAIAVMSGQRNRPTPIDLIRAKVEANRQRGLGTAFFYLESLWALGPESPQERITALQSLMGGRSPAPTPAPTPAPAPTAQPPPPPPL